MTSSAFTPELALNLPVKSSRSKLTLVGAGPGDPELITLKAIKALQAADVVLYDALVDPSLLSYAPSAQHIFVGKRAGAHYVRQEEINRLIVAQAFEYGHVVRLKGGDPFIFGRGQEEIEFAAAHGIPFEYVPGISSAVAVPGLAGIPLTARGTNESFWVTTGTTSCGVLSADIDLAAQSSATVIILMGMSKLAEIRAVFMQHRRADLPVAVIQNGSFADEKRLYTTLNQLLEDAEANDFGAPAVIVLGEVVALNLQPLAGVGASVSVTA